MFQDMVMEANSPFIPNPVEKEEKARKKKKKRRKKSIQMIQAFLYWHSCASFQSGHFQSTRPLGTSKIINT